MALPTDAGVDMLVCDNVEIGAYGKVNIIGYFPSAEVTIDPATRLPVQLNLSFLWVVRDGDGHFRPHFRLLDPLEVELHQFDRGEFAKTADKGHLMPVRIDGIPIVSAGTFTLVLELDGQPYRRTFRIVQ